jgi:ACS family 4-hydroxyphenylacetate permease-like MFS transporter
MASPGQPIWHITLIAAIPPFCTIIALPLWSAFSDRLRERYWCAIVPMFIAGLGWLMAAWLHSAPLQMLGLTIAGVASTPVWSLFFTMPSAVLPRSAHAAGIAFLNTIGMCGAATAPAVMGYLRDKTGGFSAPMTLIGIALMVGALLVLFVPRYLLVGSGVKPRSRPEATAQGAA